MPNKKQGTIETSTEIPDELLNEILDSGLLGYSTNPDDSIWLGEQFDLDPMEWIYDHLGRHALEPILEAIIAAHPSPVPARTRLDQALKQLVGLPLRSGPKERNFPTLLLISEDWWQKYDPDGPKPNFAEIARKRVTFDMARMDAEQEKNKIDEYRKAFDRSKDALLKIVTGRSSEEQQQRRHKEQQIIKLLSDLGVAVASAGESA